MKLVITMSRRFGTGTSIIANELSRRLDIPVYDKASIENQLGENDFEKEKEFIRKIAGEPCIILGRCASEILKDQPNAFHIYVCADKEDRIRRIMELEKISYEEAREEIEKNDKERYEYYYNNTGKVWGDVNNYQMILDTTTHGIENCADILMKYFERMEYI